MLSKCHILCHKPETRDMLFRLFFFLFTSTSRLVSSRTSKIMGGLGRQMWHLPRLCVLPLSCRGGGGAEGKLESAAGTTVLRPSYLPLEPIHLPHPPHFCLPTSVHFQETNAGSYLLARPLLPQVHVNVMVKFSYFSFVAANVLHVSILHFLKSSRFVQAPLVQTHFQTLSEKFLAVLETHLILSVLYCEPAYILLYHCFLLAEIRS